MKVQTISPKPGTGARVEEVPAIRVGALRRRETVQIGRGGSGKAAKIRRNIWIPEGRIIWRSGDGSEVARVRFATQPAVKGRRDSVDVSVLVDTGQSRNLIQIAKNRVTFGWRFWMICNRCGGRCGALFVTAGGLGCRKCFRLVYASQCVKSRLFWAGLRNKSGIPARTWRKWFGAAGRVSQ
jgi:hypothetical protein